MSIIVGCICVLSCYAGSAEESFSSQDVVQQIASHNPACCNSNQSDSISEETATNISDDQRITDLCTELFGMNNPGPFQRIVESLYVILAIINLSEDHESREYEPLRQKATELQAFLVESKMNELREALYLGGFFRITNQQKSIRRLCASLGLKNTCGQELYKAAKDRLNFVTYLIRESKKKDDCLLKPPQKKWTQLNKPWKPHSRVARLRHLIRLLEATGQTGGSMIYHETQVR